MAKTKRRKAEPTARLSEQMKEILLWIYNYEHTEPAPQTYITTPMGELVIPGITLNSIVDGFVPWRPSVFIGETPTPSKITTLSNSLRRLEERDLLRRYSVMQKDGAVTRLARLGGKGSRMRTTHVDLSHEGSLFALASADNDFDLGKHKEDRKRQNLEAQVQGLRLALDLIWRCQKQLTGEEEQKARQAGSAVIQSLTQLKERIKSEK